MDEATARTLVISTLAEPGLVQLAGAAPGEAPVRTGRAPGLTVLPASVVRVLARLAAPLARRGPAEVIALLAAGGALALFARLPIVDPASWRHPGAWLGATGLALVSFLVHELGHAAALVAGGGRPGAIVFVPRGPHSSLSCRVLDAATLDRAARVRLDLAGVVAQGASIVLACVAVVATGVTLPTPVFVVPMLFTLRQLIPTPGSDGDWWLADAAGARPGGTFGRAPQTETRAARRIVLVHAALGAIVSLALAVPAARLGEAGRRSWVATGSWGAGALALGAWTAAAGLLATVAVFLLRTLRTPERPGTLRGGLHCGAGSATWG